MADRKSLQRRTTWFLRKVAAVVVGAFLVGKDQSLRSRSLWCKPANASDLWQRAFCWYNVSCATFSASIRIGVVKTSRCVTQMARHWIELLDPDRHRDFMSSSWVGGIPADAERTGSPDVFFVAVVGFTFQFANLDQLRECLNWFRVKLHPSSREAGHELEHYWQRWHERLPKGITKESKRRKVVKALENALADFAVGKQSKAGG